MRALVRVWPERLDDDADVRVLAQHRRRALELQFAIEMGQDFTIAQGLDRRRTEARAVADRAHFLDPARIQDRPVCGPEGQLIEVSHIGVANV